MVRAIFFDFDGVIHNTFDFHLARVREYAGVDLSPDEYRSMHAGNFYDHTVSKLKDVDWRKYGEYVYPEYANLKIDEELKSGLLRLGDELDFFIVSSGDNRNMSALLENNGIASLFIEILGNEKMRSKSEKFKYLIQKYSLRPEECLFITDTVGDVLEARSIPIRTIAVEFGYHDRETLTKGEPYKIVPNIEELLAAIAEA